MKRKKKYLKMFVHKIIFCAFCVSFMCPTSLQNDDHVTVLNLFENIIILNFILCLISNIFMM